MPTPRRVPLAVLSLAVALAGCPASKDEPIQLLENQATAGSRLRPQFVRGESLRLFRGWRDTARGEDCEFATAADGVLRCLPGAFGYEAYANDQCTEPALQVGAPDPCLPPSHALVRAGPDACDSRLRVLALGPALAKVYAREPGGGCLQAGPRQGMIAFRRGAELDPASFVGGHRDPAPPAQTLAVSSLVTDDGAVGEPELRDVLSGSRCVPGNYGGAFRCLPTPLAYTSPPAFGDDLCSRPAAYPKPCPGVGFAYLSTVLPGTPGAILDYEIRALDAETPIFSRAGLACTPVDPAPGAGRLLGPRLAADRFVPGSLSQVGNRLRLWVARFEGVAPSVGVGSPLDASLGVAACMPRLAADGRLRCLPAAYVSPSELFADDRCTDRLFFGSAPQARVQAACPPVVRVYRAGAPYDGPAYERLADGGCASFPAWAYPGAIFRPGDEMSPTDFVPMYLE